MDTPRILVVDDEEHIREIIKIALEAVGGFQVIGAQTGAQALELAGATLPDAIVLDVRLPGMDGPTVFAALRADPRTANIPVVWLTASVQGHERRRVAALGGAGLLSKPFDPLTLHTSICELLGWPAHVPVA